jgi:hypothetical protein
MEFILTIIFSMFVALFLEKKRSNFAVDSEGSAKVNLIYKRSLMLN